VDRERWMEKEKGRMGEREERSERLEQSTETKFF